jgi:hypothetical protein
VNYAAADMMQMVDDEPKGSGANMDEMARSAELEAESAAQGKKRKFVPASSGSSKAGIGSDANRGVPGEIDIEEEEQEGGKEGGQEEEQDDSQEDEQETKKRAVATRGHGFNLAEKAVPAAVFGHLKSTE